MRDHSKHIELDREEAVATILAHCAFAPAIETVPLEESYGRTLACDEVSAVTLPNCLSCNMDSVALHWSDFENGMPDISEWRRGEQWQFANTGVGMPEGFDTAIAIENARVSEDDQTLEEIVLPPSRQYAGTSPVGSRIKAGDLIAAAGAEVTPLVAAALAAGGLTQAHVLAKPRVAFIPTGNELVQMGEPIGRGKNIESNSVLVRGKIIAWGGEPVVFPIVRDKPDQIEAALRKACAECDIVVLNAGSSKGSDDWAMEILDQIGEVFNHETSHGPGHHSSFAMVDGTPIVGISGPSLGAAFTTDFYLKPLIQLWYGHETAPRKVRVRLAQDFPAGGPGSKPKGDAPQGGAPKPGGEARPAFVRDRPFYAIQHLVLAQGEDGVFEATPLRFRPSLTVADASQAYYPLNKENAPAAGDIIEVELRG